MKTVRCINPKGYQLTRGNEYEVEEINNYYRLTNDAGRTVSYYHNLFEDVEPEPTEEELAVAFVESIRITYANNQTLTVNANYNGNGITFGRNITNSRMASSCGISDFQGLDGVMGSIRALDIPDNCKLALFKAIIQYLISSVTRIFVTMSTTAQSIAEFEPIMEELCTTSVNGVNPNSNNAIYLWVFEVEQD